MIRSPACKARILVVEDEALIAEEIAERLRRLGYEVVGGAAGVEDAVLCAQEKDPDLILMDIRLKGPLDGIVAAERIHRERDIPVVYLTAHSDEATVQRARSSAPFGYVLKPFQEKDLVIAIEMALQRHGVERRLRESERRWVTTLKSIGDGVIATDSGGRVTFMNPAAERITGWSLERAGGRSVGQVAQLVAEGAQGEAEHPIEQALRLRGGVTFGDTLTLVHREGHVIPIEDSASPLLDDAGAVVGAVMAFRDCRERHAARETLRRTEERLQEALRLETVGRLAGGVAHDFNNMLTVILGCCELLAVDLPPGGPEAALLREIQEAGNRASSLTHQLLAIGRRQVLEPRVVELQALLAGAEGLLRRVLGDGVELVLEPCADPLHVRLDPSRFEQALVNLGTNARDAMGAGGGRLTVRLGAVTIDGELEPIGELVPGRYGVVQVADTGSGMDEETRGRIFEPFFTTKPGRGTGLGLATVYGTVKQLGGHVEVASEPGQGATFSIYLPLAPGVGEQEVRASAAPGGEQGTETILLVEDDPSVRRMACSGLASFGYTVLPASDAAGALRLIESGGCRVDLLVTDVALPGRNGRELAQRLQARDPGLRVLYVSGYTDDATLTKVLAEEQGSFLVKPFTSSALARKVREVLDG